MKYNIGDLIMWIFPIDRPEVSTIVKTYREFDGTIVYMLETVRKDEGLFTETFTELELNNICDDNFNTAMATHYPVKQ